MKLPERIQNAMQMQVEAERQKRATILESEGIREAEVSNEAFIVSCSAASTLREASNDSFNIINYWFYKE